MDRIKSKIRTIPDFPKKGVIFRDITTLLKDPNGFREALNEFVLRYKDEEITKIAGIETRGFIIAGALADRLHLGFVPIRKKGKLPHKTFRQEYDLEYGKDTIEIHRDALTKNDKVLIVDDLIATGGTAGAATKLVERIGAEVVECAFIIDLPDLGGSNKLKENGYTTFSLVEFKGK